MAKFTFDIKGVMMDVSRNAVISMDNWRTLVPMLKDMGYNTLLIYSEDTYEIEGEPYFGYLRGRYSKAQLRELDDLAYANGMELIPCIQTLGHLTTLLRWREYKFDTPDALLVGDERNYELIENMFRTMKDCFRTKRIHVGMDEAWSLGTGNYLRENGYENVATIMKKHLSRVCAIAEKYGYELLIWSDMFFRGWNGGKYYSPKTTLPEEYVKALPESVIPVYWNYYNKEESVYLDMLFNHRQLSDNTWFAGGAWTWLGYGPDNKFTLESMIPAVEACKKTKTRNFIVTVWGDNGSECSKYAVLPSLFYIGKLLSGVTDEEKIKAKFRAKYGIDFDDFMLLDKMNNPYENEESHPSTAAKYLLFNDYFAGMFDNSIAEGTGKIYKSLSERLSVIARGSRRFAFLFDSASKLCNVLALKAEIGIRTRVAYKAGDKEELLRLANEDYTEILKRIRAFKKAYEKQWTHDNTYNGFEVQDYRLGGLIERTDACRKRLTDYAKGKLKSIPELEYELLTVDRLEKGRTQYFNSFTLTVTGNVM